MGTAKIIYGSSNSKPVKTGTAKAIYSPVSEETIKQELNKRIIGQSSPFPQGTLTPSNMQSVTVKKLKDTQTAQQLKTTIPSVSFDNLEFEVKNLQEKKAKLHNEMETARKNWEDWKNSDTAIIPKVFDYIGNKDVNDLRREYENKKVEYENFEETLVSKEQELAEKRIQQNYGVTGAEYINQLKEKKKEALTDSQKDFYKNQIKNVREKLYGKTNVFKHIGNIANEGVLQVHKGVSATFDFLLGTPAKWLGFENNFFTQLNNDATRRLQNANNETYISSQYLGDTNNISGQLGTALIAAVPDLLITIYTGGASKGVQLGSKAIAAANPTFINRITTDIVNTAKSPIFYSSFVQQLGVNYEENLESGKANESEAALAALFASTVTARMEMGGFQSLGDELAETKGFWKKAYKWFLSSLEEGVEEPGQTSATNAINKLIYDHDKKLISTTDEDAVFNPIRASKEFGVGTFVGAVLGGGQLTFSGIISAKENSQYKQIGKAAIKTTNIQEIINYAKSSPNDTVRLIAREVNANSISDADAGRLYQYAVTNVNEKFDDVYTVEDLNAVVNEYFLGDIPQAVKDIASASFANKLVEMNIEPETNEVYNSLTNNLESDSNENSLQDDSSNTIDNEINNEYNNDTRGEEYVRTDEFRNLQAESQGMSDEDIQLYRSGNKTLDDGIRERFFRSVKSIFLGTDDNGISNAKGLLNLTAKNNAFNIYEGVNPTVFRDVFEMARKYLKYGELVDLHTIETTEDGVGYNDCYNYLSEDGLSGFSITPDGDLISVFNASGKSGFLRAIAPIIKEKAKTLDCYASENQNLMAIYSSIFGFKPASIMDYNMDFDHDNIAENHSSPKIAFMVNTEAEVETKEFSKEQYYEAVDYRNSFVETADTEVPANFMPENEKAPSSESGEYGLSDPTDQEIHREPTAEEYNEAMFSKMKTAKQRHILDVAGKLDSGMKVIFVSENARVLSGQNAVYMRDSNTIYLSKSNSAVESYYQLFKHEFIHRLESKGAYQGFKNYLFRNSSSFERYARAQLGKDFKGNREEALQALAQKYIDKVQNGTFTQDFKKSFAEEDAQYEMVADFISEVLFKGNRKDVAQNLADNNLEAIYKIEDTLTEFENLTETDRNWFEKIVDWFRDLIASLKGVNQNKRLVEDLEYIEKRLGRVYDSWDTKKTASRAVDRQFSLKIIHTDGFVEELSDARNLTDEQAIHYLKKAKSGKLKWDTYIPIRKDTPQTIIETLKGAGEIIENRSLVMQVRKAQQAMSSNNKGGKSTKPGSNIRKHALEPNEIIEIINNIDSPNTVILQTNRYNQNGKALPNNVAIFVEYSNNGKEGVAVVEFDSSIDSEFIGTEFGDTNYHTAVTIFEPDTERQGMPFDYMEELLENPNNFELKIERRQSERSEIGKKRPNTSSELPSIDSVPQENDTVNSKSMQETEDYSETLPKGKQSFSLGSPAQQMRDNLKRYESGEITREEYLEKTDELWGEANETYGMFPTGEKAKAPIATPQAVGEDKPTERFTRTIIETGKLTDEMLEGIEEKVLLGEFSYEVISDDKALEKADTAIKNGTAEDTWENVVHGKRTNKNQIAIGERLLKDAIESGNTKRVLELSAELADIFTRAGQVVQAARLLKKMTGTGRLVSLQRTVKTLNGDLRAKYGEDMPPIKISLETAKRLAEAKTKEGIEHAAEEAMYEVAEQMPVTFLDKWNAWRYFAMLSNPKTHIRNIVGNVIFVPATRIRYFMAAAGEQAVSGNKRTKSLVIKKDYRDFAKKDAKNSEVINLLKGNKYNDKSALREKQRIFKSEVLEFLTRTNSNALEAEDMWFKNKHYIHALAGFLQARNVNLKTVSQEVLDEARVYAVEEAKKATFNDESALANWIQNLGNKNLATSIAVEGVLPFKRTPINIVKRGVEYSPIGLTKTLTKGLYDVKKGKVTLTEFIDGLASGLTGTGIMLVGMLLANCGWISAGEDDDEKSQFEKMLGKQEYAIEVLGKSYTVDWAAPACIPFFIGAEIVNTINEGEDFQLSQFGNAVWNSLEPITNLSMLSGMQGFIESARYADSAQTLSAIAIDALTSYGMQVVPSLSGAVARTIDPTQRSWYTDKNDKWLDSTAQAVKNNIQSKVPGLSYTQIPKIDMWGREISRGGTTERVLENFVSPGYYSKIEVTETSEELKRIFNKTDVDVFPSLASKSFDLDGKKKYLTADEYVTYAKAKGEYSYDYIKELMEASSYERLTDEEKADVIQGLYEYANAKAKTTVSSYDLMKRYKTVTNWEQNGRSAVDYYIYKAISK